MLELNKLATCSKNRVEFSHFPVILTPMNDQLDLNQKLTDYERVEQAIHFLEENFQDQPDLEQIAQSVHLSKFHFQRLFKRWAGVTPTQFLGYLTIEYAKERLKESQSILDTTLDAGLSSPGRLHDLFVTFEAMTPGEYKNQAEGLPIQYAFHPTPFGQALIAVTDRGVCAFRFLANQETKETLLVELKEDWPGALFTHDPQATKPVIEKLFSSVKPYDEHPLHLFIKGTNFQLQVWRALLSIPPGAMTTYQEIAHQMGRPSATRAVASAIACNPIGYIIPCHRVISKVGKAHQYRWGASRKKAILGWEASRCQALSTAA